MPQHSERSATLFLPPRQRNRTSRAEILSRYEQQSPMVRVAPSDKESLIARRSIRDPAQSPESGADQCLQVNARILCPLACTPSGQSSAKAQSAQEKL